jgi:hypothetical protein
MTLLMGPLLLSSTNLFSKPIQALAIGLRDMYDFMLVFSVLFSLPTLATYYIIFKLLKTKEISPVFSKLILILWTIIGLTTTMLIIGGSAANEIIIAYSASAIISGLLLRMDALKKQQIKTMQL